MAEESHRISEKEPQDGILGPSVLPPQAEANLPSTAGQSDPKHTRKPTSKWLKTNKMNPLEWPGQSPDLRSCGMTLDLTKANRARKPSNVAEFCKIPPRRSERLIASYLKGLIAVIAAKGGPTS